MTSVDSLGPLLWGFGRLMDDLNERHHITKGRQSGHGKDISDSRVGVKHHMAQHLNKRIYL